MEATEKIAQQLERLNERISNLIDTNKYIAKTEHEIFDLLAKAIFFFGVLNFAMMIFLFILIL